MKNSKGITLVALVITIIVLLILAGITLNVISGENGILTNAKKAKIESEKAKILEAIHLKMLDSMFEDIKLTESGMTSILEEYGTLEGEGELKDKTLVVDDEIQIPVSDILKNELAEDEIVDTVTADVSVSYATSTALVINANVTNYTGLKSISELHYTYYYKLSSVTNYITIESGIGLTTASVYPATGTYDIKVEVREEAGGDIIGGEELGGISYSGTVCFVAGTQVLTETGMKNIEEIELGEKVYSINTDNNQRELKEVTKLYRNQTNVIYEITIGDEVVKATPRHQFYIVDKGWIRAYDLVEGDRVVAKDDTSLIINNINIVNLEEPIPVYNLAVEGNHNYLVTTLELLVHNATSPS